MKEGLAELGIYMIILVIATVIALIFPRESTKKLPFEIFIFIAVLVFCLLTGLVFAIITTVNVHRKKELETAQHEKYSDITKLYRALVSVTDDIDLKENHSELLINRGDDELAVFKGAHGYRVCLNHKTDAPCVDEKDIYFYILEFLHDKRKDSFEIEIYDTQIKLIDDTGITYIDDFDREQYIIFTECTEGENDTHVGEYDLEKGAVRFFAPNARVKLLFRSLLVRNKKRHVLTGKRSVRVQSLKERIEACGYILKAATFPDII